MYNKDKYKEILDYVKEDLGLLDCEIKSLLSSENRFDSTDTCADKTGSRELFLDISDFLFAKSKRLRPLVLFLIKDALKKPKDNALQNTQKNNVQTNKDIIKLAAALELLHSATLIHDDIIDDAGLRRLLPTLNVKYGPKIAVISGDYLLSLCLKTLSELNRPKLFEYFSENTLNICKGEIDQFFNKNKVVTIEEYIEKSKNKTSSLFVAGAKSLLYIMNSEGQIPDEVQNAILNYVLNFSLAFQIYDDIENFQNSNSDKSSSDIENGILTLPYLYISQQNYSYGMIDLKNKMQDKKLHNEALCFSKEYLKNILNKAKESLEPLSLKYKTDMLQKLVETFEI